MQQRKSHTHVAGDDAESRIYTAVFESVMTQRLKPGTKLPESTLCELFGASRATVRKVLQRLEHDHIVELRPHRGAAVAAPTPDETRQIFEARRVLESSIVRLATANATRADIAALRRQLKVEREAMHALPQADWVRLASAFHTKLADLAGNPILTRFMVELASRSSLIVALYEPPGNAACEHDEHRQIVDQIERRDPERAAALLEAHLTALERNIAVDRADEETSLGHMLGLR